MAGRTGLAAHVELRLNHLVERKPGWASHARSSPLTTSRRRYVVRVAGPGRGAEALARFRARRPEVTALAAFDDTTALAAIDDLGLRCPEDLVVMGFGAMGIGSLVPPALTAVHVGAERHGRFAARV